MSLQLSGSWIGIRNAVLLLFSIAIMATTLPGLGAFPNMLILLYYLLMPGYAFSLVLRQTEGILRTIMFSFLWSTVILASVYSLTTVASNLARIPISGLVPVMTIILTVYAYYHGR